MGLKLQSSIGGSVELNAPATNSNYSVTMPAQSGTMMMAENYQPSFKNRIINGAMMIDQRNAGASVTQSSSTFLYPVDRSFVYGSVDSKFTAQQNSGSVTPPVGFSNYLGCTSSSAYTVGASDNFWIQQRVEGLNVADLNWGTVNAATVTLSFWVRSSLTGTFGGSIQNGAANRSYPFSYVINAAHTWEQKTITIAGDTTGTWLTTNGMGMKLTFSLGSGSSMSASAGSWAAGQYYNATGATSVVGTNGATFYITGVQLEKGSTATSFDYRPYGTELALCQRYYYKLQAVDIIECPMGSGYVNLSTNAFIFTPFPVALRVRPSALEQSGTGSHYSVRVSGGQVVCNSVPTFNTATLNGAVSTFTVASGLTPLSGTVGWTQSTSAYLAWSAEL